MITEVEGVVVEGDHRGRTLGFPTANLSSVTLGDLPEDGIYGGNVVLPDGSRFLAAISVGSRPTYYGDGAPVVAEAYLLDFDGDLYGQRLRVLIATHVRGQLRFTNEEGLKAQIAADVAEVRAWSERPSEMTS